MLRRPAIALLAAAIAVWVWLFGASVRAQVPVTMGPQAAPSPGALQALACPAGNLLARAELVRWIDTEHATALLTDGAVVPEGAGWLSPAVIFTSAAGSLTFDLGAEVPIRAVYLQADATDAFSLFASTDGRAWKVVNVAEVSGGAGMRSRSSAIDGITARFIRFGEPKGDGSHAATELALYCEPPADLAATLRVLPRDPDPDVGIVVEAPSERLWLALTGSPWLTPDQAALLKLAIGLGGIAWLLVGWAMKRRAARTGEAPAWPRLRAGALVALAVLAHAGYYNFGAYHFPDYIHHHEVFHYFTGAKYFPEIGYTHLYECAAAVDVEQGFRRRVELGKVRDLGANAVVPGANVIARAEGCKKLFSPERWAAFKQDIAYFRDHTPVSRWQRALRDHGFNPSPAWTMGGAALIGDKRASRTLIGAGDTMFGGALGLVDPALLLIAFGAVAWAFGWQAMCLGVIAFGVSPLSHYLWTGGAFLRQDWLALSILGVCLLKKGHPAAGGVSLGYAALLRVFPIGFLLAIGARVGWTFWKERRVERAAVRVLLAAALTVGVMVPVSGVAAGGLGSWAGFLRNTEKQATTPSANLVGLRTVMSFRPSTRVSVLADVTKDDVFEVARRARKDNFAQLLPVYLVAVAAAVYVLVRAVRRIEEPWVLAALGVALVPVMTELSCYYLSFLAIAAFAFGEREEVPLGVLVLTAGIAVASRLIVAEDVFYAVASAAICVFAAWLLWSRGRPVKELA